MSVSSSDGECFAAFVTLIVLTVSAYPARPARRRLCTSADCSFDESAFAQLLLIHLTVVPFQGLWLQNVARLWLQTSVVGTVQSCVSREQAGEVGQVLSPAKALCRWEWELRSDGRRTCSCAEDTAFCRPSSGSKGDSSVC